MAVAKKGKRKIVRTGREFYWRVQWYIAYRASILAKRYFKVAKQDFSDFIDLSIINFIDKIHNKSSNIYNLGFLIGVLTWSSPSTVFVQQKFK